MAAACLLLVVGCMVVSARGDVGNWTDWAAAIPALLAAGPALRTGCTFAAEPAVPYTWDPACAAHGGAGCKADNVHDECRFCGIAPFPECPRINKCTFKTQPKTPFAWDPACAIGMVGCKADGMHTECRFCGKKPYLACPTCTFGLWDEPGIPYEWDDKCDPAAYTVGCHADGVHYECRFCGSAGYDPCAPTTTTVTETTTTQTTVTRTSVTRTTSLYHDYFLHSSGMCARLDPRALPVVMFWLWARVAML